MLFVSLCFSNLYFFFSLSYAPTTSILFLFSYNPHHPITLLPLVFIHHSLPFPHFPYNLYRSITPFSLVFTASPSSIYSYNLHHPSPLPQMYESAPMRTQLFTWTMEDVVIFALADPTFHGTERVVYHMTNIDPDS